MLFIHTFSHIFTHTFTHTGPIGITVKFPVKPSEVANFQGIQNKLGEFARSQSGCKVFALHEDFKVKKIKGKYNQELEEICKYPKNEEEIRVSIVKH